MGNEPALPAFDADRLSGACAPSVWRAPWPRGIMSQMKLLFASWRSDPPEMALLERQHAPDGTFVEIGAKIDIECHEGPVPRHLFAHAPQRLWSRLAITEYKHDTAGEIESVFLTAAYRRMLFTGLNVVFAREAGTEAV